MEQNNFIAILKEGIMRNNHVELYEIWTCRFKIFLIWSSGGPFVRWSQTICAKGEGINSVNLFRISASGSGGDVV